jgi:NADH-quinone oxidoreductase subunit F
VVKDSGTARPRRRGLPDRHEVELRAAGRRQPHYLVVNADESEPGTCKDIPLMMANPHALVEGVIISSYAIRLPTTPSSTSAARSPT